ncbi:hypothetical protein Goarm_021687 [Gossypium armourianum]|uniref:DUF7950 domain-containing protein n=1 Tax=Gossypium armourianum TaxID=34283 RepID=A0A7J9ISE6_9ROSI|nr:hypothetical protein [Gossypium armourianum]
MEGRGGCCIARYASSGHGVYDMSKVHRIMLRFRPIAPKPATGGSVSPQGSSEVCSKPGRGKRRLSKESNTVSNTKRCNKKRRVLNEEKRVTLPLLPETPDCKEESILKQQKDGVVQKMMPFWLSFGEAGDKKEDFLGGGGGVRSADQEVFMGGQTVRVGSCVTVECVTETWVSGDGLGSTDEEKKVNLGRDTCPGGNDGVVGDEGKDADDVNVPGVYMQGKGAIHVREGAEFLDAALRRLAHGRRWICMEARYQRRSLLGPVKL